MKRKRLENICKSILTAIKRNALIDEDQIFKLTDALSFYDGREEEFPDEYTQLCNVIEEKWHYQDVQELPKEQLFVYGGIWGCLQMMEAKRRYIDTVVSESQQWDVLINKYSDKLWLLKILFLYPGIRHKDISQRAEKTPSQMSQLLKNIYSDGLITCNYAGREKFYFLSELGEKLYHELERKKVSEEFCFVSQKDWGFKSEGVLTSVLELSNLIPEQVVPIKHIVTGNHSDFQKNSFFNKNFVSRNNDMLIPQNLQNINYGSGDSEPFESHVKEIDDIKQNYQYREPILWMK